jgi:hypothetical protein
VTVAPLYDPATSDVVSLGGERHRDALSRALDTAAISAAAANELRSDNSITVIRTAQPFAELAKELTRNGYKRDGDTLVPVDLGERALSDAGDGVIVFGPSSSAAADLAASPPGGPAAPVELLGHSKDVVAAAVSGPAESCVDAFGGWHDAGGGRGVLRLQLDGTADPARFTAGAVDLEGGLDLGSPEADGDALDIAYDLENPENSVSPIDDLIQRVPPGRLYRCG